MDLTLVNIDYQNVVGLFSIAGYLRSKGYSIEIIDGPAEWVKKKLVKRVGLANQGGRKDEYFRSCRFTNRWRKLPD